MGTNPGHEPGTGWALLPQGDAPKRDAARSGRQRASRSRRGRWIGLAILAVVLVGAGAAAALLLGGGESTPGAPPAPVVLPTPTPTLAPAARDTTTPFQQALPDAVLAFAVAGQAENPGAIDAGALEAYDLTYSDGAQQVGLLAAQYATADAATAALTALLAQPAAESGPEPTADPSATAQPVAPRDDPVTVDGAPVGRVVISGTGESARAVWTNGTAFFVLQGPAAVVPAFYDAFPM